MHAFLVIINQITPSVILVQVHRRHLFVPLDVYPEAHWTLHSWHHSRLPRLRIEALVGSCRVAVTCSKTVLSVVACSPAQHLGREGEFGSVQPHGVMGPSAARSPSHLTPCQVVKYVLTPIGKGIVFIGSAIWK
jgi:hypothetical protein